MLLVDHHHAERLELNVFANQRMGSDQKIDGAILKRAEQFTTLSRRGPIRQQLHGDRPLPGEGPFLMDRERNLFHKRAYPYEMLFGEHFGGRHQCRLMTILNGHQRGGNSDERLPGTHVALQEAMHWKPRRKIVGNLVVRSTLGTGKRKGERLVECLHHRTVSHRGRAGVNDPDGIAFHCALTNNQHELQAQQFVERQSFPRCVCCANGLRLVNLVHRPITTDEIERVLKRLGKRIGKRASSTQRLSDPSAQFASG